MAETRTPTASLEHPELRSCTTTVTVTDRDIAAVTWFNQLQSTRNSFYVCFKNVNTKAVCTGGPVVWREVYRLMRSALGGGFKIVGG